MSFANDGLFDVSTPPTRAEVRRAEVRAARGEPCRLPTVEELAPAPVHYADGRHLLVEGDALSVMAGLPDRSVDLVITDPPYSQQTHDNAVANRGGRAVSLIHFDAVDEHWLRDAFAELGRLTRGWVIATVDYRHAFALENDPPPGLRMLRVGVWTKIGPMPQISGDRPGMGWEAIVFLHRTDTKPTWNGGGRSSVWNARTGQGAHPTEKPQAILRDWVRLFSEPDWLILDPFAGSASTAVAAKHEGRRSISVERDPQWLPIGVERLSQEVLF